MYGYNITMYPLFKSPDQFKIQLSNKNSRTNLKISGHNSKFTLLLKTNSNTKLTGHNLGIAMCFTIERFKTFHLLNIIYIIVRTKL